MTEELRGRLNSQMDEVLYEATISGVVRLVREVRRQQEEIAHLRAALERVATAAVEGCGPWWLENFARTALEKKFLP